ncbi:MAG: proton-conducting transporter membrane subunit [Candidatus Wallbacteria bacterium]
MINNFLISNSLFMPIGLLFFGAIFNFMIGSFYKRGSNKNQALFCGVIASMVLIAAMANFYKLSVGVIATGKGIFSGNFMAYYPAFYSSSSVALQLDPIGVLFGGIILVLGFLVTVYSAKYMQDDNRAKRYFTLLLLMIAGMLGVALSADMFNMYVFFELMSIASYILIAYNRNAEAVEASFKYLVYGSVGTMIALFGMSILFQVTGTLNFEQIYNKMHTLPSNVVLIAAVLIITGFGVKSAMVPLWFPDAHTTAPAGIAALLSGALLKVGVLAIIKSLLVLPAASAGLALAIMAAIAMTIGNFMALTQSELNRMLAYSSVAQLGYIILGIGLGMKYGLLTGIEGGLFHILTHSFMKGAAFLIAGAFIYRAATGKISDLRGISEKMPLMSICFAIACLALAGIPPFSGFMSKLLIYKTGIELNCGLGLFFTCIAIFNSILSCGYYLPLINTIYSRKQSEIVASSKSIIEAPFLITVPVLVMTTLTIVMGVYPEFGLNFVKPAANAILVTLGGFKL